MPCGDYNCTNDTAYLMNSYSNYWVLHVTDTVDYTTLQVPEWPQPYEKTVQVYPNPTNNKVWIVLPEDALVDEVKVYNVFGQVVKKEQGTNDIDLSGLVEGVYLVRIRDKEGRFFLEKVMVR